MTTYFNVVTGDHFTDPTQLPEPDLENLVKLETYQDCPYWNTGLYQWRYHSGIFEGDDGYYRSVPVTPAQQEARLAYLLLQQL